MITLSHRVKLYTGEHIVRSSAAVFAAFGSRCLIVTGKSAAKKSGALDDCAAALEEAKIAYTVFDGIGQNPQTAACHAAGKEAREFGADFIVGVGGGSPMDAAKAVAIFAANPAFPHDGLYRRQIPAKALPVLLVGTTAGTGSEVTGVSVLTNSDTGLKKSISGVDCYAAAAFCDFTYTLALPQTVTVSTALDALAHAVESALTSRADDVSLAYSEQAVRRLSPFLFSDPPYQPPSAEMREQLYDASVYAGAAIDRTGTCFPHTLGYLLTERLQVPHGVACVAFLRDLTQRAEAFAPARLREVEAWFGAPMAQVLEVVELAVPRELRLPEAVIAGAVERYRQGIANFGRSPGGFTPEDAGAALRRVLGG